MPTTPDAPLNVEDETELDRLYSELTSRAQHAGSILSSVELGTAHARKDLNLLRFYEKHWMIDGPSMTAVNIAYEASTLMGKDPMEFISTEQVQIMQRLWTTLSQHDPELFRRGHAAPFAVLVLGHPGHEEYIYSLVMESGIKEASHIRALLESGDNAALPLIKGQL